MYLMMSCSYFFLSYVLCHLVFQSKVLQKLYPAAPKLEKQPSPPHIEEALAKKIYVKRKASPEDTATGKIIVTSKYFLLKKYFVEKNISLLTFSFDPLPFFQNT